MNTNALWYIVQFLRFAIALYCAGYGINEALLGQDSAKWPTTEGKVTGSHIKKVSSKFGPRDVAEIKYQYAVNGKTYTSDRIKFGGMGSLNQQLLTDAFKPGSRISIHYKANDPAVSCIETGVNTMTVALCFAAAGLLGCIGLTDGGKSQNARSTFRTISSGTKSKNSPVRGGFRMLAPVLIISSLVLLVMLTENAFKHFDFGLLPTKFLFAIILFGGGLLFVLLSTSLAPTVAMLMRARKLTLAEKLAKLNAAIACGMSPFSNEAALALGLQAEVAQEQLNYTKAVELCQKALNALESSPRVEIPVGGIGEDLHRDKAMRDMLIKNQREKSIVKSLCHESLGCILFDMGRHSEALEHAGKAKRIAQEYLRDASGFEIHKANLALSSALALKGKCEILMGSLDEARDDLKESVKLRKELPKQYEERLAATLGDLANTYSLQSETGSAVKLIDEGLQLVESSTEPSHLLAKAKLQSQLADVRMRAGQLSSAEGLLADSLNVREELLPAGHPEIASTYISLANLRVLQGKDRDAETYRKSAHKMLVDLRR